MAEYFVAGQRFVVSPELWIERLPRETLPQLRSDLQGLVELEQCRELGVIVCSDDDWAQIVEVAKLTAFEIGWRPFADSVGLSLEVR